jgi:hypothetical protein
VKVDEVARGIEREYERVMKAVDALGPRASTASVTEENGWTARDVLAHFIHYAGMIAFGLGAPGEPPAYVVGVTERLSGEEWNRRAVEFWRDTPIEDVRAEFDRNVNLLVEYVRLRSDDDMLKTDAIPWPGEHRPLWQFIGYDTFLHEWPVHAEQIERAAAVA